MRISDWSSDVCSSDLADDRRHLEPGDRAIAIGRADHGDARRRQADLLLGFAQRGGGHVGIARIDAPAGKGDLAGMAAQRFGALGEDYPRLGAVGRSEEHTSELQSLMRISYAGFCMKKKKSE